MSSSQAQIVQDKLECLLHFLEPFKSLANAHMTHFISRNLWENLPENFQHEALPLSIEDMHGMFWKRERNYMEKRNPTSIEKFFHDCRRMSLSSEFFRDLMFSVESHKDISEGPEKCMSPKKTHEVNSVKEAVAYLCESCRLTCVVDVGGGKGYLGASLVLGKNMKVLSIDSKPVNTKGALNIFKKLEKQKLACGDIPLYKQVTALVTPETDLYAIALEHLDLTLEHKICLTGLHVCGDLASTSMQLFCKNQGVHALCNVGCCYNLLTERFESNQKFKTLSEDSSFSGFPLSKFLNQKKYSLGRNARMIACQPMERIIQEQRVMNQNLFWRAVVQVHFERLFGIDCELSVGRQCSKAVNLADYFAKVEHTVNKNLELNESKISELAIECQQYYEKMVKFYCFRLALAPVVESLIILDKLLYLHEQAVKNAYICKVFDGVKSPRCYAIIGMKM